MSLQKKKWVAISITMHGSGLWPSSDLSLNSTPEFLQHIQLVSVNSVANKRNTTFFFYPAGFLKVGMCYAWVEPY